MTERLWTTLPIAQVSHLHLFEPLKEELGGKQFATDADMKQAVTYTLPQFLHGDVSFGATMGQMLKCQWQLCGVMMCTIITYMPCIQ